MNWCFYVHSFKAHCVYRSKVCVLENLTKPRFIDPRITVIWFLWFWNRKLKSFVDLARVSLIILCSFSNLGQSRLLSIQFCWVFGYFIFLKDDSSNSCLFYIEVGVVLYTYKFDIYNIPVFIDVKNKRFFIILYLWNLYQIIGLV